MVEPGNRKRPTNDENLEPAVDHPPPAKQPRTIDINLPNRWEDFTNPENTAKGTNSCSIMLFICVCVSEEWIVGGKCFVIPESKSKLGKQSKKKTGNTKHSSKPATSSFSKTVSKQQQQQQQQQQLPPSSTAADSSDTVTETASPPSAMEYALTLTKTSQAAAVVTAGEGSTAVRSSPSGEGGQGEVGLGEGGESEDVTDNGTVQEEQGQTIN